MPPPNLIYVMPDEWRADAFGFAGNPVIRTPHLDALASRGAVFRQGHCESPVCMPSRASLATGLYPSEHGLDDNAHLSGGAFPPPERTTFMHRLQRAGYRTAAVGKMHFFSRPHGPDELRRYGFDDVVEEFDKLELIRRDSGYTDYLADRGLLDAWREEVRESMLMLMGRLPGPMARPERLDPGDTLDAYIGRQACDYIGRAADGGPFMLWVGFVGPHMPYDGPTPYSDLYDAEAIPLGPVGFDDFPRNEWGEYLEATMRHLNCARATEADYRAIGKHYYGSATLIDEQVGAIAAAVQAAGIGDDTWLFFGSDHGELLGDHGFVSKRVFYRSAVEVPQLVVPPALPAAVEIAAPTQNFDLVATMLDLAGADASGYGGRTLRPALDGGGGGRDAVLSQIAGFTMVADGRFKLVVHNATRRPQVLYDLDADPDERDDVLGRPELGPVVEDLVGSYVAPLLDRRVGVGA